MVNGLTPDPEHSEYGLWFGGFPGGSGINYQSSGKRTIKNLAEGNIKIDVIDCTLANGSVTPTVGNINWVPNKPATLGAVAAGLTSYIIDNNLHNADYMAFTTQQAAIEGGYNSYTNASYLVIVDEASENSRKLMRAEDAGLEVPAPAEGEEAPEYFVVIDPATGEPVLHDQVAQGQLEFDGEVNGVKVKTAFTLLKESVDSYTMDEYAEITGIPVEEFERIGTEYTSHGPRVCVWFKGGATTAVNGLDEAMGGAVLRALVGANQMTGGNTPYEGASTGNGRYDISTVEGKPDVSSKNATYLSRTGKAWEATDEYANRVAAGEEDPKPMLPWYQLAGASDSQCLMSMVNQYPYQCKILVTWMNNVLQGTPGAMRQEVIDRLADPAVIPLHICCDIVVGEEAQYADYIVPDVTQYESFGLPTIGSTYSGFGTTVRWQVATPGTVQLDDGRYASWEAFLVDVAKACGLPGWGDGAIVDADGNSWSLNDASDLYLKAFANLAYAEDDPVDDISAEEAHLQGLDELPDSFKNAVSEADWPKVQMVMSRGGRYWPMEYTFGEDGRSKWTDSNLTLIYSERRALATNSYTGESLLGVLHYYPQTFVDWSYMTDRFSEEEYPFTASEHKPRFRSVSMLSNSPIMRDVCAHNYVEMNDEDAAELGISDGDTVVCTTPAGDVTEGVAMVRGGQTKGAFSVSFGYGHLAYGAQDVEIDGQLTEGNPAIGAGTRILTMLDPTATTGDVLCILGDKDVGCPGRSGGMFKIEKA